VNDLVRDLELMVKARHGLVLLETDDDVRAHAVISAVAERCQLPHFVWRVHRGLALQHEPDQPIARTIAPQHALENILRRPDAAVFEMARLGPFVDMPETVELLVDVHSRFARQPGALFFVGEGQKLPDQLEQRITRVDVAPPSPEERWRHVQAALKELGARLHFDIDIDKQSARRLVDLLAGLTLHEIDKLITRSVIATRKFDAGTVDRVRDAKAELLAGAGAVEYVSTPTSLDDVAGLRALKDWLGKRAALFDDPSAAEAYGLAPPRGVLLLGVPGCGKSMCAKAIAGGWKLPLLRLDAGSLYGKYLGESEANFRQAIETAEAMAPVVLWIDEIEKAFSGAGNDEGGTTRRLFGAFLQWMQDKQGTVFLVATANDVTKLPPELLRKGRFDEIFFVDLPGEAVRADIFRVHLKKRGRDPAKFDLAGLAAKSEGFSGAEIEQAVVSALYSAFSEKAELATAHLERELAATRPLSLTRAESIAALRAWAAQRTVPAD
jgi:SpoVK/Ycf46/Vps4 family AAA+-type ATPase